MLLAFVSQKGGAGKTTMAALLAEYWTAAGKVVRLADGDPSQGSLRDVARASAGAIPTPVRVFPDEYAELGEDPGLCLLDTPGGLRQEFFSAVLAADMLIIPVSCSGFDLRTLSRSLQAIKDAEGAREHTPPKVVVPNGVRSRERLSQQTLSSIRRLKGAIPVESYLPDRSAFRRASIAGLRALPSSSRRLAVKEVEALAAELETIMEGLNGTSGKRLRKTA